MILAAARLDSLRLPGLARREIAAVVEARRAERDIAEAAAASNLWHSWGTTPISINRSVWQALTAIRARSRERGLSDPLARRYVHLAKQNVVGPSGPKLNSMPLNSGGLRDDFAARVVEEHWKTWTQARYCDVTGRLSFREICNATLADVIYDGEALVQRVPGGPHGVQVRLIDPERLDFRLNKELDDGGRVVMGVEVDANGRCAALHLLTRAPTDRVSGGVVRVESERIPAEQILHIFVTERSGQLRGIPWMISVVARMKMLHGYIQDAEMASRLGAKSWLFYKTESGLETGVGGAVEGADGSLEMDLDDVGAQQIGPNDDVILQDPAYPHAMFDPYVKGLSRIIAVGTNVSYHSLSGDLEGVNFSSIRQGVLEDREAWKSLQNWLFEQLCTPVFHWWLESAIENNVLTYAKKGETLPLRGDFAKLSRHSWTGRRWSWVDPLKEMQALQLAVGLNVTSVSQIIAEQGYDRDEVFAAIAEERKRMKELGIGLPDVLPTAASLPAGQEESDVAA